MPGLPIPPFSHKIWLLFKKQAEKVDELRVAEILISFITKLTFFFFLDLSNIFFMKCVSK